MNTIAAISTPYGTGGIAVLRVSGPEALTSVLSETAIFTYKCDEFYHPEADGGILLSDPSLNIDWQVPVDQMILSEKDKHHPLLADFDNPF